MSEAEILIVEDDEVIMGTLGLAEIQAEALQRNHASRRLLEKVGFHLLRAIPGDPHSDTDFEDCFLFVLSSQNRIST